MSSSVIFIHNTLHGILTLNLLRCVFFSPPQFFIYLFFRCFLCCSLQHDSRSKKLTPHILSIAFICTPPAIFCIYSTRMARSMRMMNVHSIGLICRLLNHRCRHRPFVSSKIMMMRHFSNQFCGVHFCL